MGINQQGLYGELQAQAVNYLTEIEANPVWIEYDLPLVSSYDSPMSTDLSSHNRSHRSAFYPNDRTGQQPLAKISGIEDAKGMDRIKHISSYLHSFQINIQPYEERRNFINKSKSIDHEDNVIDAKRCSSYKKISTMSKVKKPKQQNDSSREFKKILQAGVQKLDTKQQNDSSREFKKILQAGVEKIDTDNVIDAKRCSSYKKISTMSKVKKPVNNTATEKRSKCGSTVVILYRNVILNETYRMRTSIDIVVSEAMHLFGLERTQIFFDLLDDELFNFGSAGAISDFVPNMAESTVRQHVIAFFEHASEMMNRLMTLLLSCPDSKQLQQVPEERFISLLQSFIVSSSLKSKTKEGNSLSSEGAKEPRFIMVDSVLGAEVLEYVLGRLWHGDVMVVYMFMDTSLESSQVPERIENRPIPCISFPSDCRLFIYIPTENGSYWHQLDMQRANRIHPHST